MTSVTIVIEDGTEKRCLYRHYGYRIGNELIPVISEAEDVEQTERLILDELEEFERDSSDAHGDITILVDLDERMLFLDDVVELEIDSLDGVKTGAPYF